MPNQIIQILQALWILVYVLMKRDKVTFGICISSNMVFWVVK